MSRNHSNPPFEEYRNSRLSQYETFKAREQQRKRKYRQILQEEIDMKKRCEQSTKEMKAKELGEIKYLVSNEYARNEEKKKSRIKTEQKYMLENMKLISPSKAYKEAREHSQPSQHPFVHLIDKQDERKEQAKQYERYHNQLNEVQLQLKKQRYEKGKEADYEARRNYENYVEEMFRKKDVERHNFEKKYLRLSGQTVIAKPNPYFTRNPIESATNVWPDSIGLLPNNDRRQQLDSIDRSLRIRKQTMPKIPDKSFEIHQEVDVSVSNKPSVRQASEYKPRSPITQLQRRDDSVRQGSRQSNYFQQPSSFVTHRQPKTYKHYDTILGTQRSYLI